MQGDHSTEVKLKEMDTNLIKKENDSSEKKPHWVPLESNPTVLTQFMRRLGVGKGWAFADCLGLSSELLAFVAQPCLAVLFLFSSGKSFEPLGVSDFVPEDLYFMKQLVGNACGSIAVLHALCNNLDRLDYEKGGALDNFFLSTISKTPDERGLALGLDEGIAGVHDDVSKKGQTKADDHIKDNFHFICFINKNEILFELDGTKSNAINHGATTEATFLSDVAKVIHNNFISKNPSDLFYSVITLGPSSMSLEEEEEQEVHVSQDSIAYLVSMGFDPTMAREALTLSDNNVDTALNYLCSMLG